MDPLQNFVINADTEGQYRRRVLDSISAAQKDDGISPSGVHVGIVQQ